MMSCRVFQGDTSNLKLPTWTNAEEINKELMRQLNPSTEMEEVSPICVGTLAFPPSHQTAANGENIVKMRGKITTKVQGIYQIGIFYL